MNPVVRYILSFLLYGHDEAVEQIDYTSQLNPQSSYPLTILGTGLEGELVYPDLTAPQVEQLPNGHYVIHTDLIYNTFFLISRAEEVINPQRDNYGRFLTCHSRLKDLDWATPLVDQYSVLLLQLLHLPLPQSGLSVIRLTHDIDTLTLYRHLRGALGGMRRGQFRQVLAAWRDLYADPAYTFPWMISQDAQCAMHHAPCEVIYFVKHTLGHGIDFPQYNLHGKDYLRTAQLLQHSGAQIGIHSSAYADEPLPHGQVHRSHYLSCSIHRMQQLVDAGYTDDYSMGFADCAGFRLQTSRAVRWINPYTRQLTALTLHPLTAMDCTLSNPQYMHLNEDEAFACVLGLIHHIQRYHGELTLLWHNTSFADGSYHLSLYPRILQAI